ncbi:hypothetical protein AB0O31_03885 [Kitasatospora cineracea]|uniref:hypothetical protein n=1 Tax=Kitasatospora TaxID=2063 RepID=UPI00344AFC14
MTFLRSSIPHFAADPAVRAFFETSLGYESIEDAPARRASTRKADLPFSRHLREAFEYLLRERPCDVYEWSSLTGVAYEDEAHLYGYLQGLFDYLYEGAAEPPQAPDAEAPMPAWVDERWGR